MASFGIAETSLLFNTSGIHAATGNPQRIRSGTDGGGSTQQRRFCTTKTRHQQMHTDVYLLMRYLHPLFQKTFGKDIYKNTRLHTAYIVFLNTKAEKPQKFLTIYLHGYRQFFLSVLCALSGLCVFLIVPQRRRDRKRFSKGFLFDSNYTSSITNYQLFYT